MLPYDFFWYWRKKAIPSRFDPSDNIGNRLPVSSAKTDFEQPRTDYQVGFVKDTYKGNDYIGLTCAACHTARIKLSGKRYSIDGGPAGADMETFMADMVRALKASAGK